MLLKCVYFCVHENSFIIVTYIYIYISYASTLFSFFIFTAKIQFHMVIHTYMICIGTITPSKSICLAYYCAR
jgi:hypothetical protein